MYAACQLNFSKVIRLVATGLVFVSPSIALAQSGDQPSPGPEHKKLESRVGKWEYEGEAQATPFGPAGKFSGVETSRMVLNGFFLENHWEDKSNTGYVAAGIVLTGYDAAKKSFADHAFENDGSATSSVVTIEGTSWKSEGNRTDREGKSYKTKWTSSVSEDGMTGKSKSEYSTDDGKTWLPFFELTSKRVSN
jgi:hypothetical protein